MLALTVGDKAGPYGFPVNSPECCANNLVTLEMHLSGGVLAWHVGVQSISLQAAVCVRLYWNAMHRQS